MVITNQQKEQPHALLLIKIDQFKYYLMVRALCPQFHTPTPLPLLIPHTPVDGTGLFNFAVICLHAAG